jgi:hypothetical protein
MLLLATLLEEFSLDIESKNELCVVHNPCRDVALLRLYVFSGDVYYIKRDFFINS